MQSGLTAGAVAAREGHVKAVDLLCRAGANMRATDKVNTFFARALACKTTGYR